MSHRTPRRKKAQPPVSSGNSRTTKLASPLEQKTFLDFYNANDYEGAQDYASELAQRYPHDPFAWKVWGSCLQAMGEAEKAYNALKRAYQLNANDAQTCHLLARTQKDLGNADSALDYARKVVFLEPDFAQGRFTLAQLLAESSYGGEAFEHVDQAEALGYNRISCLVLRGHLQEKGRRFAELRSTIDTLLQLDPENPHTYNDLANYHKDLGQFEQAEQAYIKALELDPQFHAAALNRIICAHYNPTYNAKDILDTIQQLQTYLTVNNTTPRQVSNNKKLDKTIKIGLVSPGLRLHPVGQMITTALEQLSPGFELYAYSTNTPADIITQRIRNVASKWQTVGHLDEDQLADQIQSDGIDILIDLAGYGDGSRLKTMTQKPAPLIVKWVGGLINTMGIPAFDYLISDNIETPEGVDEMYTEKLIRLPNDYICYLPPEYAPAITALPALKNRFITLGCFNNPAKINTIVLEQWASVMKELPNSQLLLKSGQYENEGYCQYIHDTMAAHGITPERILLEGQSKHQELLETYNRVDIALDTWPYSGGVTTCEAFMMGVPVVTLPGPTFAGRHSATHLVNAGMPELVVNSWEEYRQRVIELALDIPNLSVIRACLRQFLIQSPVCDAEQFGKHFSTAMRAIWQRYCEGKSSAALYLDNDDKAYFLGEDTPTNILFPQTSRDLKTQKLLYGNTADLVAWTSGFGNLKKADVEHIISECEQTLFDHPDHNKAFFTLTQALLSTSYIGNTEKEKTINLSNFSSMLNNIGWGFKKQLYTYWLREVSHLTSSGDKEISVIIISNQFKDEIFKNIKEIRKQGKDRVEIIFVNNGCIDDEFKPLTSFIDIWVKTKGNAGAYLARNIGAVFSSAPILLFVDDDGFPYPGFIQAHLDAHQQNNIVSLRGAYRQADASTEPPHYYLGDKPKIALPELEGNISSSRENFFAIGGWGDYILFGHGGYDFSCRANTAGFSPAQQLYTPDSILKHEYIRGENHAQRKIEKQKSSFELLQALHPNLSEEIVRVREYKENFPIDLSPKIIEEPKLTFPEAEAAYVKEIYLQSNSILEYGSGGSTFLAAKMNGKTIFSVESDFAWSNNLERCSRNKALLSKPKMHYVDIGNTGAWGKPISSEKWKNFYQYPLSVWDRKDFVHPDVILIDGRFRVACFVTAFLHIKKPTIVLFDDYIGRDYYHEVERLVKPTNIVGRLARFDLEPQPIPAEHLAWIIGCYNKVAYA